LDTKDILEEFGNKDFVSYSKLSDGVKTDNTSAFAEELPYFPVSLIKVLRTRSCEYVERDLLEAMEREYNHFSQTDSNQRLVEMINEGNDKKLGYFLLDPDEVDRFFNEKTVLKAANNSLGGSIEKEPLIEMSKNEGLIEEYYEKIDDVKELRKRLNY